MTAPGKPWEVADRTSFLPLARWSAETYGLCFCLRKMFEAGCYLPWAALQLPIAFCFDDDDASLRSALCEPETPPWSVSRLRMIWAQLCEGIIIHFNVLMPTFSSM